MIDDNRLVERRVIAKKLGLNLAVIKQSPDVLADPSLVIMNFPAQETWYK